MSRKMLVAGSHGVTGRAAVEHFAGEPDVTVIGASRRTGLGIKGVNEVSVDLTDIATVRQGLADVKGVTHIVFGAYIEKATAAERSTVNVGILRNLLDVVEETSPELQHVTFYQGGKAYGADLGPFKTPAREDDPRLMPPNFYYDQEDLLRERQKGKAWSFTGLRPEAVSGFATGNPMNLLTVIAVYATISKELGIPLRFPGTEAAYRALYQMTSANILAKATDWAGTTQAANNEIFNITNGDTFRWQHMWPRIAKMFGMDWADPIPTPLATYMADKGELWQKIVVKHGLQPIPYETLVDWRFGDFIFNSGFDNVSSTIKARKAGFQDCIDSEDMFSTEFAKMRAIGVIPKLT
jgi:nucleoside-diphosphate-sugar epimerase